MEVGQKAEFEELVLCGRVGSLSVFARPCPIMLLNLCHQAGDVQQLSVSSKRACNEGGGGVLEGVGNARETVVKNLCKSLRDKASAAVL